MRRGRVLAVVVVAAASVTAAHLTVERDPAADPVIVTIAQAPWGVPGVEPTTEVSTRTVPLGPATLEYTPDPSLEGVSPPSAMPSGGPDPFDEEPEPGPSMGPEPTPSHAATLPPAQRPFAWADDNEATCLTVVRGISPRRALRLLVPHPAYGPTSARRAWDWAWGGAVDDYRQAVFAGRAGAWTYVWEDNGFACSLPEAVRAFAPASRFLSVFWNVDAMTQITVATGGRLRRQTGEHPAGRPLPAEAGLDWEHQASAMLAFVERQTGVHVSDAGWPLDRADLAVGVRP